MEGGLAQLGRGGTPSEATLVVVHMAVLACGATIFLTLIDVQHWLTSRIGPNGGISPNGQNRCPPFFLLDRMSNECEPV